MTRNPLFYVIVLAIVALIASSTLFVVNEYERAFILKFSEVKKDDNGTPVVKGPGIHFKLPIIEQPIKIDSRIQTLDGTPDRIVTSEKADLIVDTYAMWRVKDFGQFYLRTQGDVGRANEILERFVDSELRTQFGLRSIQEVVAIGRGETISDILDAVAVKTPEFGIEMLDFRMKKVNYPEEIRPNVFGEMRAERQRFAKANRAEGTKLATIIRAETDARKKILIAEADQKAREIRGEGDALSTRIYADAFNKNPELYSFLRSLDAYKASFRDQGDVLVIGPDSEFFNYFKDANGKN